MNSILLMSTQTVVQALKTIDIFSAVVQWILDEPKIAAETWAEYLSKKHNKPKILLFLWVAGVILGLLLSGAALLISYFIAKSVKPGIIACVILWSIFIGISALNTLPARVLTALFGGLLGVSLSEVATGFSGLIDKAADGVNKLAVSVLAIAASHQPDDLQFTKYMIWLFVVIVGLLCLPSFVKD